MDRIFALVDGSSAIKKALRIINLVSTVLSIFVFMYMLFYFISISPLVLFGYLMALAVPFAAVSVIRRLINAPRPYEMPDFVGHLPKKKGGCSFPSRHAFSIFAIGSLCLFVNLPLGVITLVFGVIMCFCRVVLHLHFVRDVVCGALVGIISSVIGALILL